MNTPTQTLASSGSPYRRALNKVPEITLFFWIIKIMSTTVGETGADYLNTNLKLGLTNTTYLLGSLLVVALVFQFRTRKYLPGVYWMTVVLISVVGTLITDNLTDHFHVPLITTTMIFSCALALSFIIWYGSEKTLSVHTIFTARREAFYWLTILFTFALGTAAGDLIGERFQLGYLVSLLIFCGIIAVVVLAYNQLNLNAIFAFWAAYVTTRPLGASMGDLLSQPRPNGGLGFSTTSTSMVFLTIVLALVTYLSVTKTDVIKPESAL